jgi:hypothetical protein
MPIKIELFGSALKISLIKFKFSWLPPPEKLTLDTPFFDVFRGRSILSIKFLGNSPKNQLFLVKKDLLFSWV